MTLRTLMLLRHAKSSWNRPELDDHERPLSARGRRAAPAVGSFMARHLPRPERVLCSDATRTRETWALVEEALGSDPDDAPEVLFEPSLYLADVPGLLARIGRTPDSVGTLLVIGHNPGMHRLAVELTGAADRSGDLERLGAKFPTGGLVHLEVPLAHWSELVPGTCRLKGFTVPRNLSPSGEPES
jgi:phosphohistidine phosphatase